MIAGKHIDEVIDRLGKGNISPDEIALDVLAGPLIGNRKLVAEGNRRLAVLSDAGFRPTNYRLLVPMTPSKVTRRLFQAPIVRGVRRLPSTKIAVTPSIRDLSIIRVIEIPF